MRKILLEIPGLGFRLYGYSTMFFIACAGALFLTAWRAKRERIHPNSVFELAIWLYGGGLIGARLFFVFQHHETFASLGDILRFWRGGMVFYGCIIGGLIGSIIYWYRHPFPFRAMADAVAPSLAFGTAFGRLGCWFNGCCFGSICHMPWGVQFPTGTIPWIHQVYLRQIPPSAEISHPVHPTQLYSAITGFALLAFLSWYFPKRKRDGEVMALLMIFYAMARFAMEAFRDDEGVFFAGMTISQNISVLIFTVGAAFWIWLTTRPKIRHVDVAEPIVSESARGLSLEPMR
ncbi:prolipoprotein diacylglyceryl transferase [Singulisphaera sp. PoT]|uniref:prolipoprotein diacylglyceryl transferase n=1 Tax=Singulisphaera sp. PoT TaxID=3411797 RepID=UPI003BF4D3A2